MSAPVRTPRPALEALAAPAPLTLGQVALLELEGCPLLEGRCDSLAETVRALWLLSMPLAEAAAKRGGGVEAALAWADGIGLDEYRRRLSEAVGALEAFWRLVPPADEGQKKTGGSATAG